MNARRGGVTVLAAATSALLLCSPALAAGPGSGHGGGGGSGGGGSGGGEPVDTTGSLYSDLVIALRDANGTPVLKKYDVPGTETTPASTEYCVQPVSYAPIPGISPAVNQTDRRDVYVVPLQGEWLDDENPPVPLDEIGACDPQPQYAMFVKEVELERLNLTRTSDDVITRKLSDVQTKLRFAETIALEPTGRITWDGTPIDASPENAAIYQSLMKTGTIPGLPGNMAGPPASVGPVDKPESSESNTHFDTMELAAMAIGAAASKTTPINVDTIEYYNHAIGLADFTSLWSGLGFVQSADPDNSTAPLAGSERFVDFSGFSYNRSQTFKGSVTWLNVPQLKWEVSHITDVVPFTDLSTWPADGTLHGVVAFAQLADDVRALCNYIPDNTFIPGFFMDVPGVDTYQEQLAAIHDPAVDLGTLPDKVFQTYPFQVTASLLNPWGGSQIDGARLRLTVHAPSDLADGDVTATATDQQPVPFTAVGGDLVGWWGPATGFPVSPGYNQSTTFDVNIANGAPVGVYDVTLDLVRVTDDPLVSLAQETGQITVNPNTATVLWAGPVAKYATQGTAVALPVKVYSPPEVTTGQLTLTVTGDDPTTPEPETLTAGDVRVYGSDGTAMVRMSLTPNGDGALEGTWPVTLTRGYTTVTWYATVATGALVGDYSFGVVLDGANPLQPLDPAIVAISAAETHSQPPPDVGEDTTPPVVSLTKWTTGGTSATFEFLADDAGTTFQCQLVDGVQAVVEDWTACTSPKTYTGLAGGSYAFAVRGTNRGGLVSEVVTHQWTAGTPAEDTTPPTVLILSGGVPGSTATFSFEAGEPIQAYACQLQKSAGPTAAFEPCGHTITYSGLKPGTYVLSVRATDLAGNESVAVSSEPWTVSKGGSRTPRGTVTKEEAAAAG